MGTLKVKTGTSSFTDGNLPYVKINEGWRAGKVLFEKTGDTTWTERWRDKDNKVDVNVNNSPTNDNQYWARGWQNFNADSWGVFGSCPDPTLANFPNISGVGYTHDYAYGEGGFLYMYPSTGRSSIVVSWSGPSGSPGSATFVRDGSDGGRERFKLNGNSNVFARFIDANVGKQIQITLG